MIDIENNNIVGIYEIRNLSTGKVYIGQSKNIEKRWSDHKYQLRNQRHHNDFLQRAWNKYGENDFVFNILELVSEKHLPKTEEKYVIKLNSSNNSFGYNLTTGGEDYIVSEYTLNKKRKNGQSKSVLQFSLDGDFLRRWHSVNEIERETGYSATNISGCCNFRRGRRTVEGFIWIHEDYFLENGLDLSRYVAGTSAKPVLQISKDGQVIKEHSSARAAEIGSDFSYRNISQVCNGEKKTHLGFIWKFA